MALFGVEDGVRIETSDGKADLLFGVSDPSVTGKTAPEGSLYLRSNGVSFKKTGPEDTDWEKASQAEGAAIGYLFVTDVTNSGNIGSESYVANTVPANTVLTECTSDTTGVTIEFMAEPAGFYSPTITLSGVECSNLSQYGDDRRLFTGSFDVNLTCAAGEYQDFVLESSTGQSTTVRVNLAGAGPAVTDITFGAYPGTQTALKAGDVIDVTVTVENDATSVWIKAGGAAASLVNLTVGAEDSGGAGYRTATGTITISSVASDAGVTAQASNALGTNGDEFASANLTIDQVYPTINITNIAYPATQSALKDSETATVTATVTNWTSGTDTISYTSPNSQLSIASPTAYTADKVVTRIAGDYNVSTNNYTITATKVANDATSTASTVVYIANVVPVLTVSTPATRLRTGSTGYSNVALTTPASVATHTITISSTQVLASVPTLADPDADKGVWANGSFTNTSGMKTFTNSLQVADDSTRGTHSWGAISATGLSGLTTTTITTGPTYVIGGFVPRYYELVLGQNEVSGAVEATTYSKVALTWLYVDGSGAVKSLSRSATINESPPVSDQYTIDAVDANPTTFIILDTAATQSMTQNTALLVEEGV
jgi:hypothetical protein